ncbi:DUF3800 domain-containing protein, partial [Mesorhizobium sp. M2C.T.Ca.TU.002.02.1.1]|uniref:DUF3800 domain-containing protein n=1 Tax=Mesorhizobium sp. M2C.T.Ca.TU.002.02.1.1 TaxID=2496788 RepID=UPI000FCC397D
VSQEAFGSRLLSKQTEFHGIEICRGSGNFKGYDFGDRLAILQKLLGIIACEDVCRIRVKINPENITHSSDAPDEIAFMYFIEQADSLFKEKGSLGMVFGDYDDAAIGKSVASLSQFRKGGTRWARGKEIGNIIDTVHFAKSHHSRMIQLADVLLYCLQFHHQSNKVPWRKAVDDAIVASGVLTCQRTREWPIEKFWYR